MKLYRPVLAIYLAAIFCTGVVVADEDHPVIPAGIKAVAPWPKLSKGVTHTYDELLANNLVQQALAYVEADDERTLKETIFLTEIPAPEFKEERRAKAFMKLLQDAGMSDVRMDSIGNVIGMRKGAGMGPTIVVDAHLDTVFPEETDVTVKVVDEKYYAPGITDDTRGLAAMLSIVRALNHANIKTDGDLIILGSVGEEGNGDLRGVKQFFKDHKNIDAYLGIESIPMGALATLNTGSNRFEVTYTAPGGHSFGAFGDVPSAIHAMGRAIAKISDMQVPTTPRTTFTVGIVKGGRSVNTIADKATMEIDVRSDGRRELKDTVNKVLKIVNESAEQENKRWGKDTLKVSIKQIGDRPSGMTPSDSMLVQACLGGLKALNQKELIIAGMSTNSGIPISLGIPAVQIGPGGKFWGFHALSEGMDPNGAYKGIQVALLPTLCLVGVENVSKPLIPIRAVK